MGLLRDRTPIVLTLEGLFSKRPNTNIWKEHLKNATLTYFLFRRKSCCNLQSLITKKGQQYEWKSGTATARLHSMVFISSAQMTVQFTMMSLVTTSSSKSQVITGTLDVTIICPGGSDTQVFLLLPHPPLEAKGFSLGSRTSYLDLQIPECSLAILSKVEENQVIYSSGSCRYNPVSRKAHLSQQMMHEKICGLSKSQHRVSTKTFQRLICNPLSVTLQWNMQEQDTIEIRNK